LRIRNSSNRGLSGPMFTGAPSHGRQGFFPERA
jgi:hypothetical protein